MLFSIRKNIDNDDAKKFITTNRAAMGYSYIRILIKDSHIEERTIRSFADQSTADSQLIKKSAGTSRTSWLF